jgi:hypothetical protein
VNQCTWVHVHLFVFFTFFCFLFALFCLLHKVRLCILLYSYAFSFVGSHYYPEVPPGTLMEPTEVSHLCWSYGPADPSTEPTGTLVWMLVLKPCLSSCILAMTWKQVLDSGQSSLSTFLCKKQSPAIQTLIWFLYLCLQCIVCIPLTLEELKSWLSSLFLDPDPSKIEALA